MPDNLQAPAHRGPLGLDASLVTVESARYMAESVDLIEATPCLRPLGRRPAHRAGLFLSGCFVPTSDAAKLFSSRLFSKGPIPVIVRLSPMGLADMERKRDLHGLAVKFNYGTHEATTDMLALNIERFMFRDGDAFAGFARALRMGPLPWRLGALAGFATRAVGRRASVGALWEALRALLSQPGTLTDVTYYGVNTFFVKTRSKERVPYRFWIEPQTRVAAASSAPTIGDLYRHLRDAVDVATPLEYDLGFFLPWRENETRCWEQVPEAIRSQLLDPTLRWRSPTRHTVGTLRLTTVKDGGAFDGKPTAKAFDDLLFDPTNLGHGLFPSDDPILRSRAGAYTESHVRRTSDYAD